MSVAAYVVSEWLIAEGTVDDPEDTAPVFPAHLGHEPDRPDDCVTFYDTDGIQDGRIMETGEVIEHPGIQVRVRATDYNVGMAKLRAIARKMATAAWTTIQLESGGTVYTMECIKQVGTPSFIGLDESKRRFLFTGNYLATITEGA